MSDRWYEIKNPSEVSSPALLVYEDRVEENIRRMIEIIGDVNRLRPHIKTHKTEQLVRLQLKKGITRFKCATIAEAEMAAMAGAKDVLLAYQPVGPNVERFLTLMMDFPHVRFGCIADNAKSISDLSEAAVRASTHIEVMIDLDIGQHRTGIAPDAAFNLYQMIAALPGIKPGGLHAYDGHIHNTDVAERE